MDIELSITDKDINDVINSDPMIKLKVQNAALKRNLEAAIEEIKSLKGSVSSTEEGKKNAKSR